MADIVQLKEDGVAKYLKTHVNAIDGVDGVLVKATGNETILGTKNFQDGIQVSGKNPVLTKPTLDKAYIDKNNNASVVADGNMQLYRRGDTVFLTGSIQLSASKYNQGLWFGLPAWAAPPEHVRMYFNTSEKMILLSFDPSKLNNIVCVDQVAKDAWITGSACWLAKNPY